MVMQPWSKIKMWFFCFSGPFILLWFAVIGSPNNRFLTYYVMKFFWELGKSLLILMCSLFMGFVAFWRDVMNLFMLFLEFEWNLMDFLVSFFWSDLRWKLIDCDLDSLKQFLCIDEVYIFVRVTKKFKVELQKFKRPLKMQVFTFKSTCQSRIKIAGLLIYDFLSFKTVNSMVSCPSIKYQKFSIAY